MQHPCCEKSRGAVEGPTGQADKTAARGSSQPWQEPRAGIAREQRGDSSASPFIERWLTDGIHL